MCRNALRRWNSCSLTQVFLRIFLPPHDRDRGGGGCDCQPLCARCNTDRLRGSRTWSASHAGQHLKKCVLELGGSDAFIILKDADLDLAASFAVRSRFQNCGRSCIAAKRIIPVVEIADKFLTLFTKKVADLKIGDPMSETTQLGPMARLDLREDLQQQVADSIAQGAERF